MARVETALIRIELACSPRAGEMKRLTLEVPAGTTLAQAIALAGWDSIEGLRAGIWGRPRADDDVLRDRDRVELYRPLTVDPKEARRQRYRKHREAHKA